MTGEWLPIAHDTTGKEISGALIPGQVDIRYFRLLVNVCVLHSPCIQRALEDVLVYGKTRKEACLDNGVSQSYFSVKYRHMQCVSQTVMRICNLINHNQQEMINHNQQEMVDSKFL